MKKTKARKAHYCDECNKKVIKKGDYYMAKKHYHVDNEDYEPRLYTWTERTCINCYSSWPKIYYKLEQSRIRGEKRKQNCPDADFYPVWQGGWSDGAPDGGDVRAECHKCNLHCKQ